jgi:hypothetical protein
MHVVLAWLAAAALLSGGLLGFMPLSPDCGSPFNGADTMAGAACAVELAHARQLPLLLLVVGVALVFAAVTTVPRASLGEESDR